MSFLLLLVKIYIFLACTLLLTRMNMKKKVVTITLKTALNIKDGFFVIWCLHELTKGLRFLSQKPYRQTQNMVNECSVLLSKL